MEKSLRNVIQKSLESDSYLSILEFHKCLDSSEKLTAKEKNLLSDISAIIFESVNQNENQN